MRIQGIALSIFLTFVAPKPALAADPCLESLNFDSFFQCRVGQTDGLVQVEINNPNGVRKSVYRRKWLTEFLTIHPPQNISRDAIGSFYEPRELSLVQLTEPQTYALLKHKNRLIFYFVFQSAAIQDLAFLRIGTFIEAIPSKILEDDELYDYNSRTGVDMVGDASDGGYDYRLSDVLRFYKQAKKQNIALNPMEKLLFKEFQDLGLFSADGGHVSPEAAILSVTQGAPNAPLDHEFNHGLYFTDARYRQAGKRLFERLSPEVRTKTVDYLQRLTSFYNFANDADLTIREYMAYYHDPDDLISYDRRTDSDRIFIETIGASLHSLDPLVPEYREHEKIFSPEAKSIP